MNEHTSESFRSHNTIPQRTKDERSPLIACLMICSIHLSSGTLLAQEEKKPSVKLHKGQVSTANEVITVTNVPITDANGKTALKDVTIRFEFDGDGNLRTKSDQPEIADSALLAVLSFRAGNYTGPASVLGGKTPAFVDGPGLAEGGATSWSMTTAPGADICTYPNSATWYVGSLENNPVYPRVKAAGITSTAWSYGVSGGSMSNGCDVETIRYRWFPGSLIGVSQSGNAITIASFTYHGKDYSSPQSQVTYRLVP